MNFWKALMADPLGPDPTPVEPTLQKVKAIDVKPYRWAVWCTIEGNPKPFANDIVSRRWSEDGAHIWFMLDTHNFLNAQFDEVLELVPLNCSKMSPDLLARIDAEDAQRMAVGREPARR